MHLDSVLCACSPAAATRAKQSGKVDWRCTRPALSVALSEARTAAKQLEPTDCVGCCTAYYEQEVVDAVVLGRCFPEHCPPTWDA